MKDYLQHGRRHGRNASDPIPGIGLGLPIASIYSNTSGVSIAADNAQHFVSLQDGLVSAAFSTPDEFTDTFENLSSTLFTGSAVYGIGIKQTGTYAVFSNAFGMSGGTAGHTVTASWAASDGSAPSNFQQGRSAGPTLDTWDQGQSGIGPHLFLHEWMTVDTGQTPAVLAVWATVTAGTAVNVAFQMMVVQLTPAILPNF